MTEQAKNKVAATLAWDAALKAGNTAGPKKATSAYTATWGGAGRRRPTEVDERDNVGRCDGGGPVTKILGVVQVGQNTGHYCGPAAGYGIIRYLHGAGFTSGTTGAPQGRPALRTRTTWRPTTTRSPPGRPEGG